jgi:hypothetical protein
MSSLAEYVIDGDALNKLLDQYGFEAFQPTMELHNMLPSQVFDTIERKCIKGLAVEIDKAKPQTVKFINLEALATGSHKHYIYAISGGLAMLIDSLVAKNIAVTGEIQNPRILPWHLVSKIDTSFRGLPAPSERTEP